MLTLTSTNSDRNRYEKISTWNLQTWQLLKVTARNPSNTVQVGELCNAPYKQKFIIRDSPSAKAYYRVTIC